MKEAWDASNPAAPTPYPAAGAGTTPAFVTAANLGTVTGESLGELVLRIYQPTNQSLEVTQSR